MAKVIGTFLQLSVANTPKNGNYFLYMLKSIMFQVSAQKTTYIHKCRVCEVGAVNSYVATVFQTGNAPIVQILAALYF
jgi:hypothetical protein